MAQEPIWAGSSSFSSGQTPFGLYDSDNEFISANQNWALSADTEYSQIQIGYEQELVVPPQHRWKQR